MQAFLNGVLDDIYIQPPLRYPCPIGWVLKLLKALYGLHHSPVKYKKEVLAWFKENKYSTSTVNSAETIWILRDGPNVLVHGLNADDFLHQTSNTAMFLSFQKQFKKRFDVKSGNVSGNVFPCISQIDRQIDV